LHARKRETHAKKDEFDEQDLWAMLSYLFNMFTKSPYVKN